MTRSIDVDTKTFIRFWAVILGLGLLGLFIWKAATGILIVLASIFLAIALRPLAKRIDNIDKSKKRNSFASITAVSIVVIAIFGIIGFAGPVVIGETSRFLTQAPAQIESVLNDDAINQFGNTIGIPDMKEQIITTLNDASKGLVKNFSGFALDSISTIGQTITAMVLIIVLTILFMLEGPSLIEELWKYVDDRKDEKTRKVFERICRRVSNVIAKYVSGQILVALLDGCVTCLAIFILSIIFGFSAGIAIPMGLIAVIFFLIPMFGPIITCVLVSLIVLISSPAAAAIFLVFYIIYEQIENNMIAPKIQGKGMALPPLVILIAITIGMYAFGLIGTIIAIPIAGIAKVLIEEYPAIRELHRENTK